MNPFSEFNHFIGYFLPGVVLFVLSLMTGSLIAGQDWLTKGFLSALIKEHFFAVLIASTIFGLLIDGVRHLFDEQVFEEPWARRNGLNWEKADDFAAYIPKISAEHYKPGHSLSFAPSSKCSESATNWGDRDGPISHLGVYDFGIGWLDRGYLA